MKYADTIAAVIPAVRPYTGVPDASLEATITLTLDAITAGVPGDLVECGTWMGGSSFAMLLAQRHALGRIERPVWMYDSFQGMSPPTEDDGAHAANWWQTAAHLPRDRADMEYCIAPLSQVEAARDRLGLKGYALIHPGWLEETMQGETPQTVAVLRVDCDWYEPVKCVLDTLGPRVPFGGQIIIDDYYAWEGAALATHEYLAENKRPWPIKSIRDHHGAWITRGPDRW